VDWVNLIYTTTATPVQRKEMMQELYGRELSVFSGSSAKQLSDIISDSPEMRPSIMRNLYVLRITIPVLQRLAVSLY
jgi:hypothetical protein